MAAMRNISRSSSTDYGLTKNTKRATGTRMNPNGSTIKEGKLTAAAEVAVIRHALLMQSGRCSGQRRGRGGVRRRRRRSGAGASRGGRRSEETKGEK